MLKEIFIPEKLGSYYLFPKRIVGIDIGKTHINATQLLLKGKTITVEKCLDVSLEAGNGATYDERAIKALTDLLQQLDPYDSLHTCLPSSMVIFKELRLPFLAISKIKLVIDFEVEPLLPFPAQEALIDFIVTKQVPEEKSSEVLVAAVQKQHVAQHLHLFAQAGANPDVVTVDFFGLYGVYKLIPAYASIPGSTALIDIGSQTTTIAYLTNGQLRFIRSLPKGMLTITKAISQKLNTQPVDVMDHLLRFGLSKDSDQTYLQAITPAFATFWQEIAFTLQSFTTQTVQQQTNRIFILGDGTEVKELAPFVTTTLGIPTELFQITRLLQQDTVSLVAKNGIPASNSMSLCAALPTPTTADFNLRKKEFSVSTSGALLTKQLITAATLILLCIIALAVHSIFEVRNLSNAANQAEQETVELLKRQFKKIPAQEENIDAIMAQAQSEIRKEEKLWFAFDNPNRVSFLTYLLELTNRINKEDLGFTIDRLHIKDNTMTLSAHVKDHEALQRFEQALEESKLFAHVERQDNPDFENMRIRLR
jgi:type IV pilus assembly protein PilM